MSKIKDKVVLITGGASGIGKLMGELCLKEGAAALVILDFNKDLLNQVVAEFKSQSSKQIVEGYPLDVSDTSQLAAAVAQFQNNLKRPVDILINNAGIIVGKNFVDHSHAEIDRTLQVNTSALMHLTKELLPGMMKQGTGHIVNIASAVGRVANPKMSVYCASKWAVIGWSESLRLELVDSHPGIKVTTVTPFYISTGMFEGVRSPIIPILKPEDASRRIIQGILNDQALVAMPWIINLLPLIKALLPSTWFDLIVGKWFGIYDGMKFFLGRK